MALKSDLLNFFISKWIDNATVIASSCLQQQIKVVLVLACLQPFVFRAVVSEHRMKTFHLQVFVFVLQVSSCLQHDAYEEIQTSHEEDVQLLSIHFLFPSHVQQMSKSDES